MTRYLLISFILLVCCSSCSFSRTRADVPVANRGKPGVILIHGYGNLLFPDSDIMNWTMTDLYWGKWVESAFSGTNVAYIYWDASRQIESQLGGIVTQFNEHIDNGYCAAGCLVFTHSTGGLVADMVMSRSYESRGTTNDFSLIWDNTIASVNIASAAGGVGLATVLTDMVMGNCTDLLSVVFPFVECGKPSSLGAGHDLRPDEARFINHSDYTRIPSLMIAGYGLMAPSLMRLSLWGNSDGLVAMHSACGGNWFPESEETAPKSCSPIVSPSGKISQMIAGVPYRYHYPIIMTKEGHASQLTRGLANIDLISTKTETLVPYETDGALATVLPERYSLKESMLISEDETHLSDLVGDLLSLRDKPPTVPNGNETKLNRNDFIETMKMISNAYTKELSYPSYSIPLHTTDLAMLNPNTSFTIFEEFDAEKTIVGIQLPRYVNFKGESVPVDFIVKKNANGSIARMTTVRGAIVDGEGVTISRFNLNPLMSTQQIAVYRHVIQPEEMVNAALTKEINLKIVFKSLTGTTHQINKLFKYVASVAEIKSKKQEKVIGENLVFPLELVIRQPGTYQMTANLFSKADNTPVAHLVGQRHLSESHQTIELKVWGKILKEKNAPGPFLLKDIMISRIPDDFSELRQYGNATREKIKLSGFGTEVYRIEPLHNPIERLKAKQFRDFADSLALSPLPPRVQKAPN